MRFSSPLGVVEYSQDRIPKKNASAISLLIAVFRCLFVRFQMWKNMFAGVAFLCFVVRYSVFYPLVVAV